MWIKNSNRQKRLCIIILKQSEETTTTNKSTTNSQGLLKEQYCGELKLWESETYRQHLCHGIVAPLQTVNKVLIHGRSKMTGTTFPLFLKCILLLVAIQKVQGRPFLSYWLKGLKFSSAASGQLCVFVDVKNKFIVPVTIQQLGAWLSRENISSAKTLSRLLLIYFSLKNIASRWHTFWYAKSICKPLLVKEPFQIIEWWNKERIIVWILH